MELNRWLRDDGLLIIAAWAQEFVEKEGAVAAGAHAPWSRAKQDMIEEGMSPGERLVAETLERVRDETNGQPVFLLDVDLVAIIRGWIYDDHHSDKLEKPSTVRKMAKAQGWFINPTRVKVRDWDVVGGPHLICSSVELTQKTPGQLAEEGLRPFDVIKFVQERSLIRSIKANLEWNNRSKQDATLRSLERAVAEDLKTRSR
jgi:hypothetical protein